MAIFDETSFAGMFSTDGDEVIVARAEGGTVIIRSPRVQARTVLRSPAWPV